MRNVALAALLVLFPISGLADDESDIVTGCLMSNAEFGNEMAQICIEENKAARAEVQRYPEQYKSIVDRCTRRKLAGWGIVKKCIDDDIASLPVLETYAREHAPLLQRCQNEFWGREVSRIRLCVEHALKAQEPSGDK